MQLPLALFSATFFPLTTFDGWLRWVVECTPRYRGAVSWDSAISVVYLLVTRLIGMLVVRKRLDTFLLT